MKTNFAAFLLAISSMVKADPTLRGAERDLRAKQSDSWNEKMGYCTGNICSVTGDPHIVTCDGLAYDCMNIGLFTIMKNHKWNIQGNFIDVGSRERTAITRTLPLGASITNDVMVEFMDSDELPTLQFGFGDLSKHDGTFLSEQGCTPWTMFHPINMPGHETSTEETLQACRKRCEGVEECTQFSWWNDGSCHLNNDAQVEKPSPWHWSRSVAGRIDSDCGKEHVLPKLPDEEEENFHGSIGKQCPLLMHVDGHMQDISKFTVDKNGLLWGTRDSPMYVIKWDNKIVIRQRLESGSGEKGDMAQITLRQNGSGPGEIWSCHWNVYICLPEAEKGNFTQGGLGLLGSPNQNTQDDWMNPEGEPLEIPREEDRYEAQFHYCRDNWCVSQIDSIMAYSGNKTYEDVKCGNEEYVNFDIHNPGCCLEAKKIIDACAEEPPLLRYACEVDCCYGGCADMRNVTQEMIDAMTLSEEDEDNVNGIPDHCECNDTEFFNTGDSVCEDSNNVVTLLHSSGSMSLPEDATVFYGFEMNVEPHDGVDGKSIRFRVNNFLDGTANMYVKHDKSVFTTFMDPVCDSMKDKPSGCEKEPEVIEVACHEYDGVDSFALVALYVESAEIESSDLEVDKCCEPACEDESEGVARFTFKIQCDCPSDTTL